MHKTIKLFDNTQPIEVKQAINEVMASGQFVKGQWTEKLEQEWAKVCGMKYAVAVSSGAMALELAIDLLFDDAVTYPSYNYKAIPNAIRRMDKQPIIDDEYPQLYAHLHHEWLLDYRPTLEDCSHCHGYKPVANTAIFSFYPTKILGACGDAGIIVTNEEEVAMLCKHRRNHGEPIGTNARMSELQAAVLLAKLPYLEEWNKRRLEICKRYEREFRSGFGSFNYVYCIPGSKEKAEKLRKAGIETAFYYTDEHMALPLHPYLTNDDVDYVINEVKKL